MTVRWGHCISNSFNVTNSVRQGGVLSPQLFNVYIDDFSDILKKSTIGGSLGGKRINHLLYNLCIVSLSSAGLQHLLSVCAISCAVLIVSIGHALCTRELVWYLTKKHTVFRVIIKVTEKLVIIRGTNI